MHLPRGTRPGLSRGRASAAILALMIVVGLAPAPARASLILSVQSVTVAAGSSNDAFDVLLTNTGSSVVIGGTSFQVTTTSPGIVFTSAITSPVTTSYVFVGHSLFGPTISVDSGQALDASDEYNLLGSGATVGAHTTVSLGRVFFNVSSATPTGSLAVTLTPAATLLTDAAGRSLASSTTINNPAGTILITPTAVPEPSSLALCSIAGAAGLGYRRFRRRRAVA